MKRLVLRLSEYQFRIKHQKGKANVLTDVLSRLLLARACEAESKSISALISKPESNQSSDEYEFEIDTKYDDIAGLSSADEEYKFKENGTFNGTLDSTCTVPEQMISSSRNPQDLTLPIFGILI